ncbi:type IV toxin-antitoxin system YeeU family antitoxin [Aeromonas veronii]|nr:type IV toxin-antitoxin system YeeU family antitoxin [Aeromonas veronii]WLD19807.1 type IV toxin-antitoxin system YeeU family antitoxin [Aeromonas veronii]
MTTADPTYSATHSPELQTLTPLPSICWGLPRDISPRFGARLIQRRYRLDFLSDRASLIGDWSEVLIAKLDQAFPEFINALEATLLTGELDAQRQHCITIRRLYLRSRYPRQSWVCLYLYLPYDEHGR